MLTKDQFYRELIKDGNSKTTANIYTTTLRMFESLNYEYTFESICSWKEYLINRYKPTTVNLRIQAMNKYLKLSNFSFKIKPLKIQPQQFVENQLSLEQYKRLIRGLKKKKEYDLFFIVKILGMTGVRISEFTQITWEDIEKGYIDIIGKGTKARRIWFPKKLQKEILGIKGNRIGKISTYSPTYIRYKFKKISEEFDIPKEVLHPHEFRAFFARNVYDKTKDLKLLQNLLGHTNIATTMLYLRKSSTYIGDQISSIVDW